jgi:hypothetical protein
MFWGTLLPPCVSANLNDGAGVSCKAVVLNLSFSMEPFASLENPTSSFSEKCIQMIKTKAVRFTEVKKYLLEAKCHKLLCCLH